MLQRLWKNYNLSLVLLGLFIVSWIGQTYAGWVQFASAELTHGETPQWFGDNGYVWDWTAATLENWQSEFLQLLMFVVLTSFLIHKGSHESKDTDEEMQASLQRIEQRLQRMEDNAHEAASLEPYIEA